MVMQNRRSFIKLGLGFLTVLVVRTLSGCGGGSAGGSLNPNPSPNLPPVSSDPNSPIAQTLNLGAGITVPRNFLGMHFHYYPHSTSGSVSPAPAFGYGTWRSHDYYGAASGNSGAFKWFNLNPAPALTIADIYNSAPSIWSELDSIILAETQAGRDIYFTICGTPAWAARPDMVFLGGTTGPSSPPASMSSLSLFITALLTRYNTNTVFTRPTPIKYLEIWNEPEVRNNSACTFLASTLTWSFAESGGINTGLPFVINDQVFFTTSGVLPAGITAHTPYFIASVTGADFTIAASAGGAPLTLSGGTGMLYCHRLYNSFFWGNSTDIAAMAKTVYQTAKSIDASITITSPGFAGGLNPADNEISSFLNASDGAGQFGKNWIDAVAIHPYDTTVDGTTSVPQLAATINQVKALITSAGLNPNLPLLISEQGWISPRSDSYFLNSPEDEQAKKIIRHLLISSASSVQKHILYSYDDAYMGTPFISNSALKQSMLNWFHQNICGKRITSCHILNSSAVKLTLENGATFTI